MQYIERDTLEMTVACGKIECLHKDATCNAFMENPDMDMAHYDGRIYYVLDERAGRELWSMDLACVDRRYETTIGDNEANRNGQFILYDGYLFLLKGTELFSAPISDINRHTLVGTIDEGKYLILDLWADSGRVYFMLMKTDAELASQVLYTYDINAKTVSAWVPPSLEEVGAWDSVPYAVNGWCAFDNVLYYFLSGNGLWKYDVATGTHERINRTQDPKATGYAFFSEGYMVVNNGGTGLNELGVEEYAIYVYDYHGVLQTVIPYSDLAKQGGSLYFAGVDDDLLFIARMGPETVDFEFGNTRLNGRQGNIYYTDIRDPNHEIIHLTGDE